MRRTFLKLPLLALAAYNSDAVKEYVVECFEGYKYPEAWDQ